MNSAKEAIVSKSEKKGAAKFKLLFTSLTGEKWPKRWNVLFNIVGLTSHEHKTVFLVQRKINEDIETVIHEMVHVLKPMMGHGKRFDKVYKELMKKMKALK